MNFGDILLLSIALAMDCFAVSIVSGVILRRAVWHIILWIAFLFGFFQAAMPLIGWIGISQFSHHIEAFDHWIAFGLLAYLGIRMMIDSGKSEEEQHFNPRRLSTQLVLAIATSIDALAVGISLAVTGYQSLSDLAGPLAAIGLGSFLFSVAGHLLGIRFGKDIRRRLHPELIGGIILLLIGFKVLISHLWLG